MGNKQERLDEGDREIIICQKQAKKFPECCGPETEANVTEA